MTTTIKTCFKCGVEKPLAFFYKHPNMKDGRVNKCKECNKEDIKRNREDNLEYYRGYDIARGNRQTKEYRQAYIAENLDKHKAHTAVSNALRDRRLVRGVSCESCGIGGILHGHHDDYNKALTVRWLCVPCHKKWHMENGEAKRCTL